jgi:hypothetical protein
MKMKNCGQNIASLRAVTAAIPLKIDDQCYFCTDEKTKFKRENKNLLFQGTETCN